MLWRSAETGQTHWLILLQNIMKETTGDVQKRKRELRSPSMTLRAALEDGCPGPDSCKPPPPPQSCTCSLACQQFVHLTPEDKLRGPSQPHGKPSDRVLRAANEDRASLSSTKRVPASVGSRNPLQLPKPHPGFPRSSILLLGLGSFKMDINHSSRITSKIQTRSDQVREGETERVESGKGCRKLIPNKKTNEGGETSCTW